MGCMGDRKAGLEEVGGRAASKSISITRKT